MSNILAVVFDIGNVLLGWQPEAFFDRKIGRARREALFKAVDLDAMNASIDLGAPFQQTIYAMRDAHPDWADDIQLWHDHWLEMLTPVIAPNVALLRGLKDKGVPVLALSNFGTQSFELARAHYPFLDLFDKTFISGAHGIMKPDPRFYALLENESGVPPERLFFIDDRRDNIDAALARGWQAHHFIGDTDALHAALRHIPAN